MRVKAYGLRSLQSQLRAGSLPGYDGQLPIPPTGLGPDSSPLSPRFDSMVHHYMDHFHVPGLAVAVVDGNQTFSRGYGIARFPDTPVTPETIFVGASTSKAFVTAALSLLIDDSKNYANIQWTTPISQLIRDDFVLDDDFATLHVTIQDAASHRTGLPRHDASLLGGNHTVRDTVRSMRFLPLTKPLRTTFQYCNLMYITLGHVVNTLTGQWLGDFLRQRLWEPLNMTSTFFSLSDAYKSGKPMARGQYWRYSTGKYIDVEDLDDGPWEGAGGVLSNVLDYSKWVRMFLDRSLPISKAGHEALLRPQIIDERIQVLESWEMYALGWSLILYHGYEIFTHNGGSDGFGSNIVFIPAKNWGCIMMSNIYMISNVVEEILTWHLIDQLLDIPSNNSVSNLTKILDEALAEIRKDRNTTFVRETLYPSDKLADIPASLPLEKYAGTYVNPGYGPWYIQYENGTLWNHMNRTSAVRWHGRLEHLSRDRFLLITYDPPEPDDPEYYEAEFAISWEGKVEKLGIDLEEEMDDAKIWFDKVA